jgi:hypothetical protein
MMQGSTKLKYGRDEAGWKVAESKRTRVWGGSTQADLHTSIPGQLLNKHKQLFVKLRQAVSLCHGQHRDRSDTIKETEVLHIMPDVYLVRYLSSSDEINK